MRTTGAIRSARRPAPANAFSTYLVPAILVSLILAVIAVYSQVHSFGFVNYDDPDSVIADKYVRGGLTPANVAGVFTSTQNSNWVPLTRLSHLLDVQLFGLDAGMHHMINVVLHALTVLLLFAFLNRATRRLWPSAWVAAVFALHPLHVESVAWITERKDVLSAFFAMLSLWCYVRYTERPALKRYLPVCIFFTLGLMSKPMLVTLPFLFLLLDFWPLNRTQIRPLLREKLPLFALSAAFAFITYSVQQSSGAVQTFDAFPLPVRAANAVVSTVVYIFQTVWPVRLAAIYSYPREIPAWLTAIGLVVIFGISALTYRSIRTTRVFIVGWLWYLVMLLPVIGVVQVGAQSHADRYMYLPMIGLSIMLAWGLPEILPANRRTRLALFTAAMASCVALTALAWKQTGYWIDSVTLFRHAVEVTSDNYLAYESLGEALAADPATLNEAVAQYRKSLAIRPGYVHAHANLGSALSQLPGDQGEAIAELRTAIAIEPTSPVPHFNLATALAHSGDWTASIEEYAAAVRLNPEFHEARRGLSAAHNALGLALARQGRPNEAIPHFESALRTDPGSAEVHNNLGVALAQLPDRKGDAISEFRKAVQLDPNHAQAHRNLGIALAATPGNEPEAASELAIADSLHPDPEIQQMLTSLKSRQGMRR